MDLPIIFSGLLGNNGSGAGGKRLGKALGKKVVSVSACQPGKMSSLEAGSGEEKGLGKPLLGKKDVSFSACTALTWHVNRGGIDTARP